MTDPQDGDANERLAVDTLARTLYGEARRDSVRAKEAIAAVVLNRVARARQRGSSYWWGGSITQVCLKPWQFGAWSPAHRDKLDPATLVAGNRAFDTCLRIARRAVRGVLKDPTSGATHYHRSDQNAAPAWSLGRVPSARIGNFDFYSDVE